MCTNCALQSKKSNGASSRRWRVDYGHRLYGAFQCWIQQWCLFAMHVRSNFSDNILLATPLCVWKLKFIILKLNFSFVAENKESGGFRQLSAGLLKKIPAGCCLFVTKIWRLKPCHNIHINWNDNWQCGGDDDDDDDDEQKTNKQQRIKWIMINEYNK